METLIQDQYEEVYEVLFVTSGSVLIGYRLFREQFWAKMLHRAIIGAYSSMTNKVSEFMYKPIEVVYGFAIKKENFMEVMQCQVGEGMQDKLKSYQNKIRKVVSQHRDVEARKFKTKIDYVDLSAFGVNVQVDDTDYHLQDSQCIEEAIKKYSNPYYKLTEVLESLDNSLTKVVYQLCALAHRYDEKLEKLMNE